jgi:hypothetical protein
MEVISIESVAYKSIMDRLENLELYFKHIAKQQPLFDGLLDLNETIQLLKVSKRTLQSYRDDGIITYHQVGNKIYFRQSEIELFLKKHTRKAFKNPPNFI